MQVLNVAIEHDQQQGLLQPIDGPSPTQAAVDPPPKPGSGGRRSPKAAKRRRSDGKVVVECEICKKQLADPSSLYRHRKIHSGDKPHKCPYCDRRFIQR